MTLDPLAQIAVLEKAIKSLAREDLISKHVEEISYTIGLLEAMKQMLEHTITERKDPGF